MPAGFERCVKEGGRVRTIKPKAGKYLHICYLNGKSYRGEVKTTKKKDDYSRKVDRKMRSYGEIDDRKKTIRVNPKKGDLIDTVIHEELHRTNPDKPEKWIRKHAAEKAGKMSVNQITKLLKRYA
jgi:hypothetical protein